jgi:hypothetical protein
MGKKVKCVETRETFKSIAAAYKSAREACNEKVTMSEDLFRMRLRLDGIVHFNGLHYVRDDK